MEHHLAKVGVAGSIPVSRFFFLRNFRNGDRVSASLRSALSACHWHAAPLAGSVYAPLRSALNGRHWRPAPHLALLFLRFFMWRGWNPLFFSFHAAFSQIDNLIMVITDISAIMGHKNSF